MNKQFKKLQETYSYETAKEIYRQPILNLKEVIDSYTTMFGETIIKGINNDACEHLKEFVRKISLLVTGDDSENKWVLKKFQAFCLFFAFDNGHKTLNQYNPSRFETEVKLDTIAKDRGYSQEIIFNMLKKYIVKLQRSTNV